MKKNLKNLTLDKLIISRLNSPSFVFGGGFGRSGGNLCTEAACPTDGDCPQLSDNCPSGERPSCPAFTCDPN